MFQIVLIKPNKITFTDEELNKGSLLDRCSEYITFIDVTKETMMENIIDNINLTTELMGSTSIVYQDADYIYQLCHVSPTVNKTSINENEFNQIATDLLIESDKVYGNAILLRSLIMDNNICEADTITTDLLEQQLINHQIHIGLKISVNGDVTEYKYRDNPLFELSKEDIKYYRYLEIEFMKFHIIIFVNKNPQPNKVNKRITRLSGIYKIYGDVIVIIKTDKKIFLDFNKELYYKMDRLSWGSLKGRELTKEEKRDGEEVNNLPLLINGYNIIEKRLEWLDENDMNTYTCTGCYRFKYKNVEDQKNNWNDHKKECLYNTKPIHLLMD
jgi:hypothetical protein